MLRLNTPFLTGLLALFTLLVAGAAFSAFVRAADR